jgi:glutamate dehydrogenase/leucine dehydrogenase
LETAWDCFSRNRAEVDQGFLTVIGPHEFGTLLASATWPSIDSNCSGQIMPKPTFLIDRHIDEFGPEQVIHLYEPSSGLRAVLVVDNTACGPAIGGVRMAADVSTEEVIRLARAMTLKNAAAGLPHGGGKAGILADPATPDKPRLLRAFARAIRHVVEYIPGPDMGTNESCMGWIRDEIGRSVGLPRVLGGIPLDEIGATGYGLAQCAEVAAPFCGMDLRGATLAVEGFGNVGRPAAAFLENLGVRLVAASDTRGTIYHPEGIRVEELTAAKRTSGSVTGYSHGKRLSTDELIRTHCDILIPAARPDSINASNVNRIGARLILQGANIPATAEAEKLLHERGVLVVPDFIANAGGVICASVEHHGGTEAAAFEQIAQKIRRNTQEVLARSRDEKIEPRQAAIELAQDRVKQAMSYRRQA